MAGERGTSGGISFIHDGGETWASYRYRARRPAEALGASLNDPHADVLVFVKPTQGDVMMALAGQARGARVVLDVCDDHFDHVQYRQLAAIADLVTCATSQMAQHLRARGIKQVIAVVPDPYEFERLPPHVTARGRLLWFGHPLNLQGLLNVLPLIRDYPLQIVSSSGIPGVPFTKWSIENLRAAFAQADIVVLPMTMLWKSPNRAVEAIRQGCAVVSEHVTLSRIPGVYVGDMRAGIETTIADTHVANARVLAGQEAIEDWYSLETCVGAWRRALAIVQEPA